MIDSIDMQFNKVAKRERKKKNYHGPFARGAVDVDDLAEGLSDGRHEIELKGDPIHVEGAK